MAIKRDAFLYLEPPSTDHDFAQCESCIFFRFDGICALLASEVDRQWSCGFYVEGLYAGLSPKPFLTADEVGLYQGKVRCEDCKHGGKTCALYDRLNATLPGDFDLDPNIMSTACCNAFTPRS